MFGRAKRICSTVAGVSAFGFGITYNYGLPLSLSLNLTDVNSSHEDNTSLLQDDNEHINNNAIELHDDHFGYQEIHPKISGTFRTTVIEFIMNQHKNKSFKDIFRDLCTNNPSVFVELSLTIGGAMLSVLGIYFARQRLRNKWFERNFYNTVNISLNSFDVNISKTAETLHPKYLSSVNFNVRTVLHSEIHELIPNAEGAKYLISAATNQVKSHKASYLQKLCGGKDKLLDPIVRLDYSTHFICYRLLRNTISSVCAPFFIAKDMNNSLFHNINIERDAKTNTPLIVQNYLIAICVEEELWSKIHVVLTRKDCILWLVENMEQIKKEIDEYLTDNGLDDDVMCKDDWSLLLTENDQKEQWKKIRWNSVMRVALEYAQQVKDQVDLQYTDFAEMELIAPNFYPCNKQMQSKTV
eukprot:350953_1